MEQQIAFRPMNDHVLVRRHKVTEQISPAGVIQPETAQGKGRRGVVLAVGPGKQNSQGVTPPMEMEPGDEVIFGQFSGFDARVDDQDVLVMRQKDVLAIIIEE